MHLLVPSAFRPDGCDRGADGVLGVSMHLLVPSAFRPINVVGAVFLVRVSMHLLVPSAFRLKITGEYVDSATLDRLNAPSGAQCFPTLEWEPEGNVHIWSQCTFWCPVLSDLARRRVRLILVRLVSMHLLVPSAFRLRPQKTAPQRRLPKRNRRRPGKHHIESARTCLIKPHNREKPPQTTPAPPTPPTH